MLVDEASETELVLASAVVDEESVVVGDSLTNIDIIGVADWEASVTDGTSLWTDSD